MHALILQAQGVANKAKNAVSDLSDLPNPFKGSSSPQGLANDAKNKVHILRNFFWRKVLCKGVFHLIAVGMRRLVCVQVPRCFSNMDVCKVLPD